MNFNIFFIVISFLIGFTIAQEAELFKPKLLPPAFANNLTYIEPGGAGAASLADTDTFIFTCGGRNATHVLPLCQAYNVPACLKDGQSARCRIQNRLKVPRWGAGAGRAFDTMYMIGGFTNVEATAVTDSIEKITRNPPVEDEYKLSKARALSLVLTSKDKIVVAGGLSYNNVKKEYVQHKQLDIFRPDPNNNGWYSPPALLKQGRAESCGGFIASTGGQEAVIIAGGRGANPNLIYKDIEILTVDDKIQDTLFELQTARYACVAVTSTNRNSVFVMGGIGLATATPGALSSIEQVFADRVETVSFALSVRRSHSALVVALPFVFVIGGQTRGGADLDLPSRAIGTNALDVLRLNDTGAELVASKPTLVDKRSYAQAAHIEELNGDKTVVVFGGFTDGVNSQPSVDVMRFSTKTYAPTPAPTPEYTEPPPTPLPPTPPPTPQPTFAPGAQPSRAPCAVSDCETCADAPSTPDYCGVTSLKIYTKGEVNMISNPIPQLCKIANGPPKNDAILTGEKALQCQALYEENIPCQTFINQLKCSYYCQPCTPNVSPIGLTSLCVKHCQGARSACQSLIDADCADTIAPEMLLCAGPGEACIDLLPYSLTGNVDVGGGLGGGEIAGIVIGVLAFLASIGAAVGGFMFYRNRDSDTQLKNKNTDDAPFKCSHCTNSYYFESDLTTHCEKRHANLPADGSAVVSTEGGVVFSQYGKTPAPPPGFNNGGSMTGSSVPQQFMPVFSGGDGNAAYGNDYQSNNPYAGGGGGGGGTFNGGSFNGGGYDNGYNDNNSFTSGSTMMARPGRGGKTQMDQLPTFNNMSSGMPMARALYDCVAEEPDELGFRAGDMIEILDQSNSEWWIGRCNGMTGNLPANFVQLM